MMRCSALPCWSISECHRYSPLVSRWGSCSPSSQTSKGVPERRSQGCCDNSSENLCQQQSRGDQILHACILIVRSAPSSQNLSGLGIKPSANCTIRDLAITSANVFYSKNLIQYIEEDIKMVPEIMQSKPDRIVVTEMFHVKAWQEIRRGGRREELYINVFYVSVGPMAQQMI